MLELCLELDKETEVFLFFVGVEFIDVLELEVAVRRLGALSILASLFVPSPFFCFDVSSTLFFGDDLVIDALFISFLGDDLDVSDGSFPLFRPTAGDLALGLWSCFRFGVCCFEDADVAFVLLSVPRLLPEGDLVGSLEKTLLSILMKSMFHICMQ